MIERGAELPEPVEQRRRLVVRFDVIGLKLQELPVDVQGFLDHSLLVRMFLIQPPEIQVSARKPWGELRGPPP